jgi:myo-inositol 2-dehydrogenase/D-chiro-inositol 1-dehydrogenase
VSEPNRHRVALGIVGLGRMGMLHAENLARGAGGVELVRVADASEDAARATGERLGVPWAASADAVLDSS